MTTIIWNNQYEDIININLKHTPLNCLFVSTKQYSEK